jgi:metal-responsive CopG/Arc/MetJ family transcriptional regulator
LSNEKLYIKPRKYRGETSVISSRLPNDMIREIDNIALHTGRNRNEVVLKCLSFALERYEKMPDELNVGGEDSET